MKLKNFKKIWKWRIYRYIIKTSSNKTIKDKDIDIDIDKDNENAEKKKRG